VQGCNAASPNDASNVLTFLTLRFDRTMNPAERTSVERVVQGYGATVALRSNARVERTYGLLGIEHPDTADAVRAATGATLYEAAIIALAVYPSTAQALPAILDALGGAGRPSGILECSPREQAAVIEWDPQRAATVVVMGLVDVELQRFGASRTCELLAPLPEAVVARITAEGLCAPEVTPERILETLVHRAGLE
jgi:hypothetical protein